MTDTDYVFVCEECEKPGMDVFTKSHEIVLYATEKAEEMSGGTLDKFDQDKNAVCLMCSCGFHAFKSLPDPVIAEL